MAENECKLSLSKNNGEFYYFINFKHHSSNQMQILKLKKLHVNVWQKPQYCKVISLQLIQINENFFKKLLSIWDT